MSKVADVLADADHNVTILQIYVYEHFGDVKLYKNSKIQIIDYKNKNDGENRKKTESALKHFWDSEISQNPITGIYFPVLYVYPEFEPMCDQLLGDRDLHQWIQSQNFDGFISETFDFCGLYLGDHLKQNIIPMYSGVRASAVFKSIGNPYALNYEPAAKSNFGSKASIIDRVWDIIKINSNILAAEKLFDRQYLQARQYFNDDVRHWKQILQTSTFLFSNSNPFLRFTAPLISKNIEIGGFTIDQPTNLNLSKEYSDILNLRSKTILISFGTMVQSIDMPIDFKNGIIKCVEMLPDVTFIWKYEDETNSEFNSRLPPNLILKKWIPQSALLADSRLTLFISHGGLASVLEIAYSGKPSIVIPIFGDQLKNSQMLVQHGGAIDYNRFDLPNSQRLLDSIQQILSDSTFQSKSQQLSRILWNQPIQPKTILLKHCEFAARFRRVESLEPYNLNFNFIQYYSIDAFLMLFLFVITTTFLIFRIFRFLFIKMFCQTLKFKSD